MLGIIGKMNFGVEVGVVVGIASGADVRGVVEIYFEVGCNNCPHPNVKLPPLI